MGLTAGLGSSIRPELQQLKVPEDPVLTDPKLWSQEQNHRPDPGEAEPGRDVVLQIRELFCGSGIGSVQFGGEQGHRHQLPDTKPCRAGETRYSPANGTTPDLTRRGSGFQREVGPAEPNLVENPDNSGESNTDQQNLTGSGSGSGSALINQAVTAATGNSDY